MLCSQHLSTHQSGSIYACVGVYAAEAAQLQEHRKFGQAIECILYGLLQGLQFEHTILLFHGITMPVHHEQQPAQLIKTAHKVCGIVTYVLRNIACLHQQLHSCHIKYFTYAGICGCLNSAEQLLWVLLQLADIHISNSRTAICLLGHRGIATLPHNILLRFLCYVENITFRIVAVSALERIS